MLHNKMLAVKYSLLGSAMLTMAGCSSLNPKNVSPLQQGAEPDTDKDAKVEKTVLAQHKTRLHRQEILGNNNKATTFLLPASYKRNAPAPKKQLVATALDPAQHKTTLDKVAFCALNQRGKPYCWGGTTPMRGFDCSGLTQYSFQKGAEVTIPRTAAAQYAAATKVPAEKAQRGDLVFFRTRGKNVSHVGLYLGKDRFVHAPRTGKNIQITKLEGYWKQRLVGFGRIPGACRPIIPSTMS